MIPTLVLIIPEGLAVVVNERIILPEQAVIQTRVDAEGDLFHIFLEGDSDNGLPIQLDISLSLEEIDFLVEARNLYLYLQRDGSHQGELLDQIEIERDVYVEVRGVSRYLLGVADEDQARSEEEAVLVI